MFFHSFLFASENNISNKNRQWKLSTLVKLNLVLKIIATFEQIIKQIHTHYNKKWRKLSLLHLLRFFKNSFLQDLSNFKHAIGLVKVGGWKVFFQSLVKQESTFGLPSTPFSIHRICLTSDHKIRVVLNREQNPKANEDPVVYPSTKWPLLSGSEN